jgi:hypothetical protein
MTGCWQLLPVDDGSVRVVCAADNSIAEQGPTRAFAFAADGRALPGWPIELPSVCCAEGRVMGNALTLYAREYPGETVDGWIVSVAPDGSVRNGERVTYPHCCDDLWAVGPNGVAYRVILYGDETGAPARSELAMAIGPEGLIAGFPVTISAIASTPAFDAAGRIHLTVAPVTVTSPYRGPARTLVFDTDGQAVEGGSGDLGFVAEAMCVGLEGSCGGPAAPLVGADGTTFVIAAGFDSTTAARVSASGQVMAGWPYRSEARHESKVTCVPPPDTCEGGYNVTNPAIGPDNVLYLVHAAVTSSAGGSIVAIGQDGRVVAGWPVALQRPGAEFWSVVVGSDGIVYALAVEPEAGDTSSASILAFARDSTVLYTTTVIEP